MVMQNTTSGLAKRYGGRLDQAVKAHSADETEYGFQRLPAGISNGVARVSKCYFDQYKSGTNKGEYYLRIEAVVVSPVMLRLPDGSEMKVAGMTTSVMVPMCETKSADGSKVTPYEQNVANAMNELRKLGGDTAQCHTGVALEALATAIQQTQPLTKFSTSVRAPRPGTNDVAGTWENWHGCQGLEDFREPDSQAGAVEDGTPAGTESALPASTGAAAVNGHLASPEPAADASPEYTDQGDLDSLAEAADNGDAEAQKKLVDMAAAAGLEKEAKKAEDYASVAALLKSKEESTEGEAEEAPPPAAPDPTVKSMRKYRPNIKGPGGKEVRAKKPIDCEVMKVDKKSKTVQLKNMIDNKTLYNNVKWEDLE